MIRAKLLPGVLMRGHGPRLSPVVSLRSGQYRLSKRRIQSLLADLLGVDWSLGSVSSLEQEISASLATPVEEGHAHAQKQGVLYFHWRVMQLSPRLVEYVVAHEVAHLKEPQHGAAFWRLLGRLMPDCNKRNKELGAIVATG